MKTSEKIIEEFDEKFVGGFDSIQENSPYREQIKSFLLKAMKTAVEEVTPEKQDENVKIDENQTSTDVAAVGYNACRSDMEEKRRKFFNE